MEKQYKIQVLGTDQIFFCSQNESVLESMKYSGKGPIYRGCFGGGCGICKMKIVKGDYRIIKRMSHAHISEDEKKDNIVLVCCVEPRSDLIISKIKQEPHTSQ